MPEPPAAAHFFAMDEVFRVVFPCRMMRIGVVAGGQLWVLDAPGLMPELDSYII